MCYKEYFENLYNLMVAESKSTKPATTENKEPVIPPDDYHSPSSSIPLPFHDAKPSIKIY